MNAIFVILALLTISGHGLSTSIECEVAAVKNISTYGIKDILDGLIESLRGAIPEIINIPPVNIELAENKYLGGYLNTSNVSLTGIKEFQADITYSGFIKLPKKISLILKSVTLKVDYLTDIALFNIPLLSIFGNGIVRVILTDLEIKGYIFLNMLPPLNVSINSMQLQLGAAKFGIEGLCNDESFSNQVNDILNKNVATIINKYEKVLSTTLENIINSFIHGILFKSTPTENYESPILASNLYYTREEIERCFETAVEEIKTIGN